MTKEMIERVVRILEHPSAGVDETQRVRVATAALLVECARVDAEFTEGERREIAAALRRLFDTDEEMTGTLVQIAEKQADDVWDDWLFAQAIKRGFDLDARIQLICELWRVALADGVLHRHEDRFVQRIAGALEVPDRAIKRYRAGAE